GSDSGEIARARTGDRFPTQVTFAGGADHQRYAASPLAADRAGAERAPAAISRRASLLAHDAPPELRPVRTSQLDRVRRAAYQRLISVGRDFYHPGNEPPAPRHDQSFQRADAQGPGTPRPIGE